MSPIDYSTLGMVVTVKNGKTSSIGNLQVKFANGSSIGMKKAKINTDISAKVKNILENLGFTYIGQAHSGKYEVDRHSFMTEELDYYLSYIASGIDGTVKYSLLLDGDNRDVVYIIKDLVINLKGEDYPKSLEHILVKLAEIF